MKPLLNLALFQAGWFGCVISVSAQMQWLALIFIITVIGLHLLLSTDAVLDVKTIVLCGITGMAIDSLLISLKVFAAVYPDFYNMAPPWLIGLWMLFGITINHSLRWFDQHLILAGIAGFVFAPLAYWAGVRFGVLVIPAVYDNGLTAYFVIGACWLVVTPMLLLLSRRLQTFLVMS